MNGLKLSKLPDRTPIKLVINLPPDLHKRLQDYAKAYAEAYEREEPIGELIPAILATFLDGDREFSRRGR